MKTSETHPIRLDFVQSEDYPALNRLGMTLAPGKKVSIGDGEVWNRELETDLKRLNEQYKVDTLVSLLEHEELERLSIKDLPEACESRQIELVQFPLKDGSTPFSVEEFSDLTALILDHLREGDVVAVHCRGGLGRTGLTVACAIVAISDGKIDGKRAIEMTRLARPGTVETQGQEDFILRFENYWKSSKN